jgi:ureidoglycolate lyase
MAEEPLEVMRITVEPLTAEAFRPHGELLGPDQRAPDFTGLNSVGWRSSFHSDSPPEVMFYRSSYSGMRFSTLERHHAVTQAFVPLGNTPSVVAVAAPTSGTEPPQPSDVRAFLLDGTVGYVLHTGTWHSLDRFPLFRVPADIVIITDRATQQELEAARHGPWERTEAVDYADRFNITFEFAL